MDSKMNAEGSVEQTNRNGLVLEAMGALDELNSHVGLCLAVAGGDRGLCETLEGIQTDLLEVGATLAGDAAKGGRPIRLADNAPDVLEGTTNLLNAALPQLERLILPGGSEVGARLHVARTVCRRVERRMVDAADGGANVSAVVIQYFNRLSDLLFALARTANHHGGTPERLWGD